MKSLLEILAHRYRSSVVVEWRRRLYLDISGVPGSGNPHVHAIASRGGWTRDERFIPIPYVDPHAAQELFRHKVLALLQRALSTCRLATRDLVPAMKGGTRLNRPTSPAARRRRTDLGVFGGCQSSPGAAPPGTDSE